MLSADTIAAAEALRIGLVNKMAPAGQALEAAVVLAGKIASRSPVAVGHCAAAI